MSNICRRCGHLIDYSLVPLNSNHANYCHFCINEFNALVEKLDKDREESMAKLESRFKDKLAELQEVQGER